MISPDEIESSKYKDVYYKNLPDKTTEFFWYGFKNSIINLIEVAYKDNNHTTSLLLQDLDDKCNLFNELQLSKQYDEINLEIEKYMRWLARHLFLTHADDYSFNIFITNMRRWSKWIRGVSEKIKFEWLASSEKDEDYFMIFFHLRKYTCEHYSPEDKEILENINLYLKKYQTLSMIKNKFILMDMYHMLLNSKYIKPMIFQELSKYFPVIADLKKIGYFKKDIPDKWSFDKAFKCGRTL
jgi:hypothetical protein